MNKKQVAHILEEIGILLEIKGENPFKCRAYHNAVRTIEGMEEDLQEVVRTGRLKGIKGIGPALAEKIGELVSTGRLAYHEELKASLPPGLLEMLGIPHLGPKKIRAIYEGLEVKSVGELEYACHENRLVDLPGFGRKTQENILQGIEFLKRQRGRFLYSEAIREAEDLLAALERSGRARRAAIAGDLRRRREVVEEIVLVASSDDPEALLNWFVRLMPTGEAWEKEKDRLRSRLESGIRLDLWAVSEERFPCALLALTGHPEHIAALNEPAGRRGLEIGALGLFGDRGPILCREEEDLFAALGLCYVPPELREGRGEVEAALRGEIPRLLEESELQGVFHVHTLWSDGTASLREMAQAARALGWRYLGISDHSQSARYARGLDPERVRRQHEEIEDLNRKLEGITLLKGIESDILPDGSLDYDEEVLSSFDFVIASVHSRFSMPEADMTDRLLKVLAHPRVTILGHPTGRLLLGREGYAVDIDRVLEEAAKRGVVVELNANPHRLDLDWRHLRKAAALGIRIAINPDAHTPEGLKDVRYGVGVARKGWLTAENTLNTRPLDAVQRLLRPA